MRLEVITPTEICLDAEVRKIVAEAAGGFFGLLPGHGDFVTDLVAGIMIVTSKPGQDRFVAVNSGTLVKCGAHVRVAVQGATFGDDLGWLRDQVAQRFHQQDEDERSARAAMARLEADMIRRFRALEGVGP